MPANVTPRRQSSQYNCVTTSLLMALESLGIPAAECQIDKVNAVLGAMPLRGASWEAAAGAASHYGCRANLVIPSTLTQVRSWTDEGCPVIIAYNLGNEWSHASLVFNVDDNWVYVADPNIPDPQKLTKKMTHDEFYAVWWEKSATGYKIRRPAMKIEREITPDGRQVIASAKTAVLTDLRPSIYKRHNSETYDYSYIKYDPMTGRGIDLTGTGFKTEKLALADFQKKLAEYYRTHPVTAKEMIQEVKGIFKNSDFGMDDEGHDFVQFATRENGSMGEDAPWDDPDEDDDDYDSADHGGYGAHYGEADMQAAVHFKKLLSDKFGPAVKITIDTTDEWVSIRVQVFPNLMNKSATMSQETIAAQEILAIRINDRDKKIRINPDDVNKRNETHRDSLINPATGAQRSWGSGKHQNRDYDVAKGNRRRPKHQGQDREASDTHEASGRVLTALWGMPDMRSWFETDSDEAERIYANEIKLTQNFLDTMSQLPRTSHAVQNLIDLHVQTEDTGMEQPVLRRSLVMSVLQDVQKLANSYLSKFNPEARGNRHAPQGIQHMLESVGKIAPACATGRIGIPMFLKMLGINQSVFGV